MYICMYVCTHTHTHTHTCSTTTIRLEVYCSATASQQHAFSPLKDTNNAQHHTTSRGVALSCDPQYIETPREKAHTHQPWFATVQETRSCSLLCRPSPYASPTQWAYRARFLAASLWRSLDRTCQLRCFRRQRRRLVTRHARLGCETHTGLDKVTTCAVCYYQHACLYASYFKRSLRYGVVAQMRASDPCPVCRVRLHGMYVQDKSRTESARVAVVYMYIYIYIHTWWSHTHTYTYITYIMYLGVYVCICSQIVYLTDSGQALKTGDVCIHTYTCDYIYIYIYIHTHTLTHNTYIHADTHTHTHTHSLSLSTWQTQDMLWKSWWSWPTAWPSCCP